MAGHTDQEIKRQLARRSLRPHERILQAEPQTAIPPPSIRSKVMTKSAPGLHVISPLDFGYLTYLVRSGGG